MCDADCTRVNAKKDCVNPIGARRGGREAGRQARPRQDSEKEKIKGGFRLFLPSFSFHAEARYSHHSHHYLIR